MKEEVAAFPRNKEVAKREASLSLGGFALLKCKQAPNHPS